MATADTHARWVQRRSGVLAPDGTDGHGDRVLLAECKTDERGREWKAAEGATTVTAADASKLGDGEVLCIASVTGIYDNVGDKVLPGAYAKTLRRRTPKVIAAHDWTVPTGKCLTVAELMPGDGALPSKMPDGSVWPQTAGALAAHVIFNLGTQRGNDAYQDCLFYEAEQEFSIGYNVPGGAGRRLSNGKRDIAEMDLFELSTVLWGANSLSRLVGGW